ncbi:MAG: gliding motility-associated C-terminal domain-containing protein [Bacteroidetes bacterium]|nr:gliding motility-associated C-terminal domain-containing protein [Bacteroidota bacterium]
MKKSISIIFLFINFFLLNGQVASFIIPDTVCVNQNVTIQNTSIGGSTYYWNFCSGNLSNIPNGINLGNLGSLNLPVYSAIAKDGNNYYMFITNHSGGSITKLSFGNSLINNPVATNLGNLGIMSSYIEGIQVKKDGNGNWYGIIAGGQNNYLGRMNFGTSLANTPTMVSLGNISNTFNYPHSLYIFQENNNWYGFVSNINNNTIVRLSFGSSLSNTPTAVNIGNIGSLSYPLGLVPILDNGIWYLFIVNRTSNSISRLNFGNSLLNYPTGINIGSVNNTINVPRYISVIRDCGKVFGFVVNETTNDIVRLTFPNGILSTPTGISLGNIANFDFPHHISELFRVGDSLYTFIMNVNNNTISRLCFTNCNNSSIPSSNLQNPPTYSYNAIGTYNVSLLVNEGLPTQSNICKIIEVIGPPVVNLGNDTSICQGSSLILNAGNSGCSYSWSTGQATQNITITTPGTYAVTVANSSGCIGKDTINISFVQNPIINLGNDTTFCQGNIKILNAGNPGSSYNWSTGQTSQTINVSVSGTYSVKVTNSNGCISRDTIIVNLLSKPLVNLGNDTSICQGSSLILNAGNSGCSYFWNTGQTTQSNTITTSGTYAVTVTNSNGCIGKDTININFVQNPIINLGNDTTFCLGNIKILNAGNPGSSYNWSTGQISQTINVSVSGTYSVKVTNSYGCISRDTIIVNLLSKPIVNLGNDTSICQGSSFNLNAGNPGCSYSWSTGQTTQSITITTPGTYTVTVVNSSGCIGKDTININFAQNPIINLGNDTSICQGNIKILNAGNPGSSYNWSTGQTSQTINVSVSGTYSVKVTNSSGCISRDTIIINFIPKPFVNLGNDTSICYGNNIQLNANNPGCTYFWNNGQITQTVFVNSTGVYSVKVTNSYGCFFTDTILVNILSNPLVNLGNDTSICQGDSIKLNSNISGCNYLWNTGQTSQMIFVSIAGMYTVNVTDNNGCKSRDTILISFSPNLAVNLGNDTIICQGNSVVLNAGNPGSTYVWNAGQNTQNITVSAAGKYWVNVNNSGCKGNDTILINTVPKPIITLGNDTLICPGDLIVLLPGSGFSSYLWSTGAVTASLNVTQPGIYSVIVTDGPCDASDEILIDECGSEIWVPNVFTPNGDGINDFFFPICTNIDKIKMYVYNRWGNQIFEGSGKAIIWDGKYYGNLCADGVYYYLIEYESKGINKGSKQKHGSVTLLR